MIILDSIIKGTLLIGWIVVLLILASLAASEKGDEILGAVSTQCSWKLISADADNSDSTISNPETGWEYLVAYADDTYTPFSIIAAVLNIVRPGWADVGKAEVKKGYPIEKLDSLYFPLFDVVDEHLKAIVQNENIDPKTSGIKREILPSAFLELEENNQGSLKLPEIALNWIDYKRNDNHKIEKQNKLIDTFFFMLVLGAFGSLVFLIKDFLDPITNTSYAQYLFRPILGMFLAMAVFLLDLLTHSFLSTSSIENLRVEPLYILGFAAGMLAEQAYAAVNSRAQKAIDRMMKDQEPPSSEV
ncbi:hypothetical protein [Maridesulfovibrio zosterae]|uniref:hypothetical protein n=1 Tax=Maridesulfovibrio zosterae TaxID=82171 RepID=UPI00048170E3|nr:hypothetical protein [Maridesulfovibrio zosterae]